MFSGTEAAAGGMVRKLAFGFGLMLLFFRLSLFHETMTALLHTNIYPLYLFGVPALLGAVAAGAIPRAFQERPAWYWTFFTAWMILSIPFSHWRGGSVEVATGYLKGSFPLLFVVGGLAVTWKNCRVVMYTGALSAVVALLTGWFFAASDRGGRFHLSGMGMEASIIGNSNDFAGLLMLLLPFLLWIVLTSYLPLRLLAMAGLGFGLYLILHSGSRGALIALTVAVLFFWLHATAAQRITILCLLPIAVAGLAAVLPKTALQRMTSFSTGAEAVADEGESARTRMYLFRKSIEYSLRYPVFGLGPGQFGDYENTHNTVAGRTHGVGQETHNSYTKVSSECGIPALGFYLAGIFSTYGLFRGVFKKARQRPEYRDISVMLLCISLGFIGYCTAITFLNFAYFQFLPAMAGFAIAISRAAPEEFRRREAAAKTSTTPQAGLRWAAAHQ